MWSETIYYQSPLGILRISAKDNAVNEVHFLSRSKDDEMPKDGNMTPCADVLRNCITQLDRYFSGDITRFDVSLSQSGTPFQMRVWDALCTIPYGRTVSYLDLSKKLGDTKAVRAVGTANGKNNIAIIVPCHRVIGNNGSLVGYAGQLWRKQWLLAHEAKHGNGVQILF